MEFFARCAWGFEEVLGEELAALGLRSVRPLHGGVSFVGLLEDGLRACLWSRVATRIQLVLARVPSATAEELYDSVSGFAWEDHLRAGATIAVRAHGTNESLRNTAFSALKVKDALCDRMRRVRGSRPDVDAKQPDFEVDVAVHQSKATLYLNLSGESLHRRGYRADGVQTEAPLKETLAAGMLLAAGWQRIVASGGVLVDPMCGSGTLAIEASMMCAHVAPGLLRTRWGFEGWAQHDKATWDELVADAIAERDYAAGIRVVAGDLDEDAIRIARDNAERAGVDDLISFCVDDAARLGRHVRWLKKRGVQGLLATNPPYGRRLLTRSELPQTYAALAAAIDAVPTGWDVCVITPDAGIDSALGRLPRQTIACYNGPIASWVRLYSTADAPCEVTVVSLDGRQQAVRVSDEHSAAFAGRLRKVARERARWARGEKIRVYRVYDADLPEYDVVVDVLDAGETGAGRLVRMAEHTRPRKADPERVARRLRDAATLSAAVLGVPSSDVVVLGCEDEEREARPLEFREDGLAWTLDAGAPQATSWPELRRVRRMAAELAGGRRVVGLFAASGPALLQAAGSGASSAELVDASRGHLEGMREVARANGIGDRTFRTTCTDPRIWVADQQRQHKTYDLVVCVVPAWLPARDAGGRDWDAAHDLPQLLEGVSRLLSKRGVVLCALPCQLQVDVGSCGLAETSRSAELVPADCARGRAVPQLLLLERRVRH